MIRVEYLVFIDKKNVKCTDSKSFEHLLQSDPKISIENGELTFENKIPIIYSIQTGNIGESKEIFFHLSFSVDKTSEIQNLTKALKNIKSVFSIISTSPQILYDGISQYYANRAYPIVNDIENLMRKLITKFMLVNVGAEWFSESVPDDVKKSMNTTNKEITYLHNVDFIQLKNFLFSEKYTVNKDKLITKLKNSKNLSDLDLNELKLLIPVSNWDKYFSAEIHLNQEKLSKLWSELYELRCKVAHNKTFTFENFKAVEKIVDELKPAIEQAIEKLDTIDISKEDIEELKEQVFGNFSPEHGRFMNLWKDFEEVISDTIDSKVRNENPSLIDKKRTLLGDLKLLNHLKYFDKGTYLTIQYLHDVRNSVVHFDENLSLEIIKKSNSYLDEIIKKIKGWL